MRSFLAFFVVLFLAFPVFGQSARDTIKADSAIVAQGLSADELDALIAQEKAKAAEEMKRAKIEAAKKRIQDMLENDSQLKSKLVNE